MTLAAPTSAAPSPAAATDAQTAQGAALGRLAAAPDRAARLALWLGQQCAAAGAETGAVWEVAEGRRRRIAAAGSLTQAQSDSLEEAALLALSDLRPIAKGRGDLAGGLAVALPVYPAGHAPQAGAQNAMLAALLLPPPDGDSRAAATEAIRQLQWGAGWLQSELSQSLARSQSLQDARAGQIVDLVAEVLPHPRFAEAAMAAVTALALRHDCARVSYGSLTRKQAKVAAISHSARFGEKMNLVRAIGAAMDEALDQQATILFPLPEETALATSAHRALREAARSGGGDSGAILTLPAFTGDRFTGAFTFERGGDDPFSPETVAILDAAVAVLAPILEDKRLNDRWIGAKLAQAAGGWIRGVFGPTHALRKLALLTLVAGGLALTLIKAPARVTADADLQGRERRAISAAFDGYIQSSEVRSGAAVSAGEVLALLDDREIALERLRRETERAQFARQYDDALAARQPALANVVRNQIEQADAQIALLDERLARTRITAPFDGYILSEDLTQRIGGAVSRGEVLFEISPLAGYRVILQVEERQIGDLAVGQTGEVVFTALPRDAFPVTVTAITPVAQLSGGLNRFTVEAELSGDPDPRLRPGITGVAKITTGEASLLALLMDPLLDWARLARWRWLG